MAVYIIAGILAFGFIASTIVSIVMFFHPKSEVEAEVQSGGKKVAAEATKEEPEIDVDLTDTESAEALLNSESNIDEYIEFNTGFIEAAKASGSLAYDPPEAVETQEQSTGQSSKTEVTCSSAFRVSIDSYREGLIKQESERWAKVSKDSSNESKQEPKTKESSAEESDAQKKPNLKELEAEHKSRLDSIEKVHQHHLKINKCRQ